MKNLFFLFRAVLSLLALALPLSCDSGGGGGSGGGNSSGKNSENSGSTSITITIPKTTSADANILGDLGPAQAKDFQYEIFYSTKSDGSSPSESKYAKEGESVTFENVKYDTYTFFLKIWVSESRNALLDTFKVEKTVSASDHTVNFPDRSYSKYSNWYFVSTTVELTTAIGTISTSNEYGDAKKAVICLMDIVEMSGGDTAINSISERCTLEKNGFKIVEKRFEVTVSPSITDGTVIASPTGGEAGDPITLTVEPSPHYKLESISYTDGSTTGEPILNEVTGKYTFIMPNHDVTVNATFKLVIPEFKITLTAPSGIRNKTVSGDTVYYAIDSDLSKEFTLKAEVMSSTDSFPSGTKFSWKFGSSGTYSTATADNPKNVNIATMCGGISGVPSSLGTYDIYCTASLDGADDVEKSASVKLKKLPSITISGTSDATGSVTAKVGDESVTNAMEGDNVTLTISPATGYEIETLKKGDSDVTSSISSSVYTFTMGDDDVGFTAEWKAEVSETCDIGSVVLKSGKYVNYANVGKMSEAQKSDAMAVIFTQNNSKLSNRTLGMGLLQQSNVKWCRASNLKGYSPANRAFSGIECTAETSGDSSEYSYHSNGYLVYLHGDYDGSNNLSYIRNQPDYANELTALNYPAFFFAENYSSKTGSNVSLAYATGWYLPAAAELFAINDSKAKVNAALAALGKDTVSGSYWSSNNQKFTYSNAWYFNFDEGVPSTVGKLTAYKVLAIREF